METKNSKHTPLSLTERGLEVLEESGGKNFINNNKDMLIKRILDKNPPSSLDIQELSESTIISEKDHIEFIPVKEYVYNQGLIFDHVIKVMSIYLRDLALDKWKSNKN